LRVRFFVYSSFDEMIVYFAVIRVKPYGADLILYVEYRNKFKNLNKLLFYIVICLFYGKILAFKKMG